jgi:hypothetical protein
MYVRLFGGFRGIATKGSPWEYMLEMRDAGYDGVVPVDLGPLGKYNFLLSPESVKAATVEEASSLPRRFSVPLFETLELDKGLVYEQGSRHKRYHMPSHAHACALALTCVRPCTCVTMDFSYIP